MDLSRRDAFKCFLALSAAATSFGLKTAAAKAGGDYLFRTDTSTPPTRSPRLFRTSEYLAGRPTTYLPQSQILSTVASSGHCQQLQNSFSKFGSLINDLKAASPMEQMQDINAFANSFPYISDSKHYGKSEKWALPEQFFKSGGDCEDYAIAKFAGLRSLGFHPDRMRVVLLEDQKLRQYHAILSVYYGGEIYILDNQLKRVTNSDDIRYYSPICSLNNSNLWVHWEEERRKRRGRNKIEGFKRFVIEQKLKMLRHSSAGEGLHLSRLTSLDLTSFPD